MSFKYKEPIFNNVERSFLSSKPFRVRWHPDGEHFITGSYSEFQNKIELWHISNDSDTSVGCPVKKSGLDVNGDVTEIKFLDNERFIFSTTAGYLYTVLIKEDKLKIIYTWDKKDFLGDCIHGFDINDEKIIGAITSYGFIACFSADNHEIPSMSIGLIKDNVECASFMTNHELALGNLRGQISLWDLRSNPNKPTFIFPYNRDGAVGVTCIKPFPVRRHMLVASGLDGSVSTWDLRKIQLSQTVYEAHLKPVSSLVFHPTRHSNLFTTSYSGEVWHWTNFYDLLGGNVSTITMFNTKVNLQQIDNKPDVKCLVGEKKFPTNHCDVVNDKLICAADNDSLLFIHPLQLK